MAINDDIARQLIGIRVDLLRATESTRADILAILLLLQEELVRQILTADIEDIKRPAYRVRRLQALLKQVGDTIATAYRQTHAELKSQLVELSTIEAGAVAAAINTVLRVELVTVAVTPRDLQALTTSVLVEGSPMRDWWSKQSRDMKMRFEQQMRLGLVAGETNEQLVRRIRGRATGRRRVINIKGQRRVVREFKGGIMDIATRDAASLVRTAAASFNNDVIQTMYRDNMDIMRGMSALVTLDNRTTKLCMSRSGAAWDFEGNPLPESTRQDLRFPGRPPWHWGCRTVLAPVLKSWSQMVEERLGRKVDIADIPAPSRASMDGQVPAHFTYEDWLKTKSATFQKDVLGAGRYKLWKDGKITLPQLTDPAGNVISIAELRRKYGP